MCVTAVSQEYYRCRKPERTLNKCMFEKLVCGRDVLLVSSTEILVTGFGQDYPRDTRRQDCDTRGCESYI